MITASTHPDEFVTRHKKMDFGKYVDRVVTSLREAVGIIERAKVAIGPDTGLMHIAAALGTPVVSLWGATDPGRTGPHGFSHLVIQGQASCVPCLRRYCPIGRICMQSISKDQIAAKIDLALSRGQADEACHVEAV